jgi:drug/metabolite transporter superfamily protein YnfA
MNNVASILILVFLGITFLQSGYDKLFYWKDHVPLALLHVLILELISTILCIVGAIELLLNSGRIFGYYGAVFSCITLLMLLVGQRLAKDYDGARTIVIYFIPAVMAVYWLN